MTRLFVHGRTETVRPATVEAKAFVDAMGTNVCLIRGFNEFRSHGTLSLSTMLQLMVVRVCPGLASAPKPPPLTKAQREEREELLRAACLRHVQLYKDAMSGQGIDRHLFALLVVSKGMGVESEFLKQVCDGEEPRAAACGCAPPSACVLWHAFKFASGYEFALGLIIQSRATAAATQMVGGDTACTNGAHGVLGRRVRSCCQRRVRPWVHGSAWCLCMGAESNVWASIDQHHFEYVCPSGLIDL